MATKVTRRQALANRQLAMSHPLRVQIWEILRERVASPKELAALLKENIPHVSHHAKRLVQLGCAELVDTRQVRGAVEHFYRGIEPIRIDDDEWEVLKEEDPEMAEHQLGQFMQAQLDDYVASMKAGVLGSDNRFHVHRTPAVVDHQGLEEALELAERMEQELAEIVSRSAERRSGSGADALHMSACISFFKTPPIDRARLQA